MMRHLIYILLLSYQLSSFACQCKGIENLKDEQKASYEYSDLVFIGEVISVGESMKYKEEGWFDNKTYKIEVVEGFKGTKSGETLSGYSLTSCSSYPKSGTWIIYANKNDEGNITFSSCGLSRSFKEPERIFYNDYIPPPPPKEKWINWQAEDDLDVTILRSKIRVKAAQDLKKEIQWLRTMK
ncbi:hypothetical protein [Ekhidna sp.]